MAGDIATLKISFKSGSQQSAIVKERCFVLIGQTCQCDDINEAIRCSSSVTVNGHDRVPARVSDIHELGNGMLNRIEGCVDNIVEIDLVSSSCVEIGDRIHIAEGAGVLEYEHITARTSGESILASTAIQEVTTSTAIDHVASGTAIDRIGI